MTYKELIELVNLIKLNLGDQTTKGQKKLFKIYEKVKHHIDEYQSQIDEIRLDNASVDDKNNVIQKKQVTIYGRLYLLTK